MSALEGLPPEVLHRVLDQTVFLVDDPLTNAFIQLDHANWSEHHLRLIKSLSSRLHGVVASYRPSVVVARTLSDLARLARGDGGLDAARTLILDSRALGVSCDSAREDYARSLARFALRSDAEDYAREVLIERERLADMARSPRPYDVEASEDADGGSASDDAQEGAREAYKSEQFESFVYEEEWAAGYEDEARSFHAQAQVGVHLGTILERAPQLSSLVVTDDWVLDKAPRPPMFRWSIQHVAAGNLRLSVLNRLVKWTTVEAIGMERYEGRSTWPYGSADALDCGAIDQLRRFRCGIADCDLVNYLGRHRATLVDVELTHLLPGYALPGASTIGQFLQRCPQIAQLALEVDSWRMSWALDALPPSLVELCLRVRVHLSADEGPFLASAFEVEEQASMIQAALTGIRSRKTDLRTINFEIRFDYYHSERQPRLTEAHLDTISALWSPLVFCVRASGFLSDLCAACAGRISLSSHSAICSPSMSLLVRYVPPRPREPRPAVDSYDDEDLGDSDSVLGRRFRDACIRAIVEPIESGEDDSDAHDDAA